jgi:nicotinamidase-related amidase
MTTPLDPQRTALLVMDYQQGVVARLEDPGPLLERAAELIDVARAAGLTVGHVRVAFDDADYDAVPAYSSFATYASDPAARASMHVDSPTTQPHERVAPAEGDIRVRKTRVGPFTTTDLREQLNTRGIDTLVLAGISTSGVVLSTVRQASDFDYRVLVVSDACADFDPEVHRVLMTKVFPRQAEVVTVAEVRELLG